VRGAAGASRSSYTTLWLFGLANYALLLALFRGYVDPARIDGAVPAIFTVGAAVSYPACFVLAALAPSALLLWIGRRSAAWALAVTLASLLVIAVFTDRRTYEIFGFHLNGFVWNLLTTPGGVASMGAGSDSTTSAAALGAAVLALEALLLAALRRSASLQRALRPLHARAAVRGFVAWVALLLAAECLAYGWSDLTDYRPVLRQAQAMPLFVPVRFKGVAKKLGFEPARPEHGIDVDSGASALHYPLEPLRGAAPSPLPNVLWLCSESLRADMLDPEIMPATWALAQRAAWFRSHVSGSNGTRMGVFSMLYGLPGSYWESFLAERRGPVLVDRLIDLGYQIEAFTSDDFSYPEVSRTAWSRIEAAHLHELGGSGEPTWQRDRRNVGEMMQFIAGRDRSRPFFVFSFFESPHARYEFPPESVIRKPYLDTLDYVSSDFARDIALIKNRYINSVHHLDSQFARIFSFLQEQGIERNTIVIVTGDHGEEFMDAGRWGHNSTVSEAQIRVPLLVLVPGRAPEVVDRLTSHMDLPATLLARLGVENAPESYGVGLDLFGAEQRRHAYLADFGTVTYLDGELKLRFPVGAGGGMREQVSTRGDVELEDASAELAARRSDLLRMLDDLARFHRKS
jgi:membrane-anchored protein YejM (alkaline phosphatase superfamily)